MRYTTTSIVIHGGAGMVRLVPMTKTEFQAYLKCDTQRYAQEHIKAGDWHPSEALEKSREEHHRLLPNGLASKNQYLFSIEAEELGAKVGIIWFAVHDASVFIYDLLIHDRFRRRRYGTRALLALEEKVRRLGVDTISLHLFAHNRPARALYEKVGYKRRGLHMSKRLIG
jgi:RimJ/RimL family protein N-acetyltransferase